MHSYELVLNCSLAKNKNQELGASQQQYPPQPQRQSGFILEFHITLAVPI